MVEFMFEGGVADNGVHGEVLKGCGVVAVVEEDIGGSGFWLL